MCSCNGRGGEMEETLRNRTRSSFQLTAAAERRGGASSGAVRFYCER